MGQVASGKWQPFLASASEIVEKKGR